MKSRKIKKFLAAALSAAMVITCLPTAAMAKEAPAVDEAVEEVVAEEEVVEVTAAEEVVADKEAKTQEIAVGDEEEVKVEENVGNTYSSDLIDVFDFGAEQFDTSKYNNWLTEDVINSWYTDEEKAGAKADRSGINIPSRGFEVADDAGQVVLKYDPAGATNHRLRSTNAKLYRTDDKGVNGKDGHVYNGYIYSNSNQNVNVKMSVYLKAGDILTGVYTYNNGPSDIKIVDESNTIVDEFTAEQGSLYTFYAPATGMYSMYSVNDKLCVAHLEVKHPKKVNVSGIFKAPLSMSKDAKLVFTCDQSGAQTEVTPENNAYSAEIYGDGYTYTLSLKDANGYVISSDTKVVTDEKNALQKVKVVVQSINLVKITGQFKGVSAEALAQMKVKVVPQDEAIYIPELKIDGVNYEVEYEYGTYYDIAISDLEKTHVVKDYKVVTKDIMFEEDGKSDIVFANVPTHKVTVDAKDSVKGTSIDLSEFASTNVTMTEVDATGVATGYVYEFQGLSDIRLRDGAYAVKLTGIGDYKLNPISNVKIKGSDVTKTITFIGVVPVMEAGEYNFLDAKYTDKNASDINDMIPGLKITGGSKHSSHGYYIKNNGTFEISMKEKGTIIINGCQYGDGKEANGDAVPFTLEGTGTIEKTFDASKDPVYTITGAEGNIKLTFANQEYVHSITVEYQAAQIEAGTYDLTDAKYADKSASDINKMIPGLKITGGSKHNDHGYYIKNNGTFEISMKEKGTIIINGCQYGDGKEANGDAVPFTLEGTGTIEKTFDASKDPVYTITGAEGDVKLTFANQEYVHKLTIQYKKKTIKPGTYLLTDAKYADKEAAAINELIPGLTITGGNKHKDHGYHVASGHTFEIAMAVSGNVVVQGCQYGDTKSGDTLPFVLTGTGTVKKTFNGADPVYTITGAEGDVKLTFNAQEYVHSIAVEYGPGYVEEVVEAKDYTFTVNQDGSADYRTINEALDAARAIKLNEKDTVEIQIAPGDYEEMLDIDIPNVKLVNTAANPSITPIHKGVDIEANSVRITGYYGHGYSYASMNNKCKYDEELLAINKENGYPSFTNPGSGTTNGSNWNATVTIEASAKGFSAEGIIFENSFNQYVSKKAANDLIVAQPGNAKEGAIPRASMQYGDTTVQQKKYVERAAAMAIFADKSYFKNCSFIGRQDTLYSHLNARTVFNKCDIYGGTDYVFGNFSSIFYKCNLVGNTDGVTSTDAFYIIANKQASCTGTLLYNCNVISTTPGLNTASTNVSNQGALGRQWEGDPIVVYYKTNIGKGQIPEESTTATSLIMDKGYVDGLGGKCGNVYEIATNELAGVDNSTKREGLNFVKEHVIKDASTADAKLYAFDTYINDGVVFKDTWTLPDTLDTATDNTIAVDYAKATTYTKKTINVNCDSTDLKVNLMDYGPDTSYQVNPYTCNVLEITAKHTGVYTINGESKKIAKGETVSEYITVAATDVNVNITFVSAEKANLKISSPASLDVKLYDTASHVVEGVSGNYIVDVNKDYKIGITAPVDGKYRIDTNALKEIKANVEALETISVGENDMSVGIFFRKTVVEKPNTDEYPEIQEDPEDDPTKDPTKDPEKDPEDKPTASESGVSVSENAAKSKEYFGKKDASGEVENSKADGDTVTLVTVYKKGKAVAVKPKDTDTTGTFTINAGSKITLPGVDSKNKKQEFTLVGLDGKEVKLPAEKITDKDTKKAVKIKKGAVEVKALKGVKDYTFTIEYKANNTTYKYTVKVLNIGVNNAKKYKSVSVSSNGVDITLDGESGVTNTITSAVWTIKDGKEVKVLQPGVETKYGEIAVVTLAKDGKSVNVKLTGAKNAKGKLIKGKVTVNANVYNNKKAIKTVIAVK